MQLTNNELEWLATHWVALNEFTTNDGLPESLAPKLHMFFKRYGGWLHYEFSDFDEAVEARILAKRKELGL